jgi:hypothetical protein
LHDGKNHDVRLFVLGWVHVLCGGRFSEIYLTQFVVQDENPAFARSF